MARQWVRVSLALSAGTRLVAGNCGFRSDCGSCVNSTTAGVHTCYWCEVDSACHAVASLTSPCAPVSAADWCISESRVSTCSKRSVDQCAAAADDSRRPQQIHLALAGDRAVRVAFKTWALPTNAAVVVTSPSGASRRVLVERSVRYLAEAGYHHAAKIDQLEQATEYSYVVEVDGISSTPRSFGVPADDLMEATFMVVGDMGYGDKAHAVATRSRMEQLKAKADVMLHVGDIGYADDAFLHGDSCAAEFCYEAIYDRYMEWLQNVTDSKPYMTAVGNHESECHSPTCVLHAELREGLRNFSAYNARFAMPSKESGGVGNMWYSFDYASVHFVVVNTETDFDNAPELDYGSGGRIIAMAAGHFAPDGEYLRWLEADLQAANMNRDRRPWVVAMGHRPWNKAFGLKADPAVEAVHEELFKRYQVDLFITGHEHNYQRAFPKGNNTATPTIITGGAGCEEFATDQAVSGAIERGDNNSEWDWYYFNKETQLGMLTATATTLTFSGVASESGRIFDKATLYKAKPLPIQVII